MLFGHSSPSPTLNKCVPGRTFKHAEKLTTQSNKHGHLPLLDAASAASAWGPLSPEPLGGRCHHPRPPGSLGPAGLCLCALWGTPEAGLAHGPGAWREPPTWCQRLQGALAVPQWRSQREMTFCPLHTVNQGPRFQHVTSGDKPRQPGAGDPRWPRRGLLARPAHGPAPTASFLSASRAAATLGSAGLGLRPPAVRPARPSPGGSLRHRTAGLLVSAGLRGRDCPHPPGPWGCASSPVPAHLSPDGFPLLSSSARTAGGWRVTTCCGRRGRCPWASGGLPSPTGPMGLGTLGCPTRWVWLGDRGLRDSHYGRGHWWPAALRTLEQDGDLGLGGQHLWMPQGTLGVTSQGPSCRTLS